MLNSNLKFLLQNNPYIIPIMKQQSRDPLNLNSLEAERIEYENKNKYMKQSNASSDLASLIERANVFIKQYETKQQHPVYPYKTINKSLSQQAYNVPYLSNQPGSYADNSEFNTKYNQISYGQSKLNKQHLQFSPIQKIQNQELKRQQNIYSQGKNNFQYKKVYKTSTPILHKYEDKNNKVQNNYLLNGNDISSDYSARFQYRIPIEGHNITNQFKYQQNYPYTDRTSKYEEQLKKRPLTYMNSTNISGGVGNQSVQLLTQRKFNQPAAFTNRTHNNPNQRPYSTIYDNSRRPISIIQNRPISYQTFRTTSQHSQSFHHNRPVQIQMPVNNLTSIQSQFIHPYQQTRYMRPQAGYTSLISGDQPKFKYKNTLRADKQTLLIKQNFAEQQKQKKIVNQNQNNANFLEEMDSLNISQIKRPEYQSHYQQPRTKKKLAQGEDPVIIFKNNWCLIGLLLLLICALIGLGIYHIRNSINQSQKLNQTMINIFGKKNQSQLLSKPNYSDPIPISNLPKKNQSNIVPAPTIENITAQPNTVNPIQSSIDLNNTNIIRPPIQIKNDTKVIQKVKQKNQFTPSQLPMLNPQQIPIIFPKVVDYFEQNKTNIKQNATKVIQPAVQPNISKLQPVINKEPNFIQPQFIKNQAQTVKPTPITPVIPKPSYPSVNAIPVIQVSIPGKNDIINNNVPTPTTKPEKNQTALPEPITIPTVPTEKPKNQSAKYMEFEPAIMQSKQNSNTYQPNKEIYLPISSQGDKDKERYSIDPQKGIQAQIQAKPESVYTFQPELNKIQQQNNLTVLPIESGIQIKPQTSSVQYIPSMQPQPIGISQTTIIKPSIAQPLGPLQVEPTKSLEFNETYVNKDQNLQPVSNQTKIANQTSKIDYITPQIISPQNIIPAISTTNATTFPSSPITPTINQTIVPDFMKQYIQPKNVSYFQISTEPIKKDIVNVNPAEDRNITTDQYVNPQVDVQPSDYVLPKNVNQVSAQPILDRNINSIEAMVIENNNIAIEPSKQPAFKDNYTEVNVTKDNSELNFIQPQTVRKNATTPQIKPKTNISQPIPAQPISAQQTKPIIPTPIPITAPKKPKDIYTDYLQPKTINQVQRSISPQIVEKSMDQFNDKKNVTATETSYQQYIPAISVKVPAIDTDKSITHIDKNNEVFAPVSITSNPTVQPIQTQITQPQQPVISNKSTSQANYIEPTKDINITNPDLRKQQFAPISVQPSSSSIDIIQPIIEAIPFEPIYIPVQPIRPQNASSIVNQIIDYAVEPIPVTAPTIVFPEKIQQLNNIIPAQIKTPKQPQITIPIQPISVQPITINPIRPIEPATPIQVGPIPATPIQTIPIIPTQKPIPIQPTTIQPIGIQPTPIQSLQPIKPIQPIQVKPTPVQPIPLQPIQIKPAPISPIPREPIQTLPTPIIPTPIQPTPIQPIQIMPIPIQSKPIQIQPVPIQPVQISPTPIKPIQTIEPQIVPQNPTSIPQNPISIPPETNVVIYPQPATNQTANNQTINNQTTSKQPQDKIIQTNIPRKVPYIFPQNVQRLTPLDGDQVIYQVPKDFDKSLLPKLEKEFLQAYNKILGRKSPFEIIPINSKIPKGPEAIAPFQNQYKIYYAPVQTARNQTKTTNNITNTTSNTSTTDQTKPTVPEVIPLNINAKPVYEKQTIIQILGDGSIKILQKGSDWAQISKHLEDYKKYGVPTAYPPNIKKGSHNLKRQQIDW